MLSRQYQLLRSARAANLVKRVAGRISSSTFRPVSLVADSRSYSSTAPVGSSTKPFEKVIIANRGEIVQRIIRTCKELDIPTVAVYSTADAKAPFVAEADEAICVGPAAASESYLNTDNILAAVDVTGADALHPGYGFLSENMTFCKNIQDHGVAWLGPPPHAVRDMGDKLISKQVAKDAGVRTIPGFDGTIESIDHALDVVHNTDMGGYPILLKAAAGGGGKGMRVCRSDQDVHEAWGIAKSEAKKFFNDDRLLIEKFIDDPHHIEYQVACHKKADGTIDTIVFPERECSIQRRNQKIIEESPSALITETTRRAMAEQVRRLCQAVEYESAGTVEFLVDGSAVGDDGVQKFYFLEMNTRLQVEHPVSEAVCGGLERDIDLVKAMIWIGAGLGFPEEFEEKRKKMEDPTIGVLPFVGHAMESRVYAEDPLRSFLPSTGPLVPYREPSMKKNCAEKYVRVDSGVCNGHVVSPHYDPMLSKVITYSSISRTDCIAVMNQALDEYIIQGVQHNTKLIQSVLREKMFVDGNTPTSFLPTHYPPKDKEDGEFGFEGVKLTDDEMHEFAVAAAAISSLRRNMLQQPPLAGSNDADKNAVVVRLDGGLFGAAYKVTFNPEETVATVVNMDNEGAAVKTIDLTSPVDYEPENYVAHVTLDGNTRTLQVLNERSTGEVRMQMYGCDYDDVIVQSVREYELSKHMHEPVKMDTSSMVLSPMPGTLISFAVVEGEEVQVDQELCIVEAMKMQNIIRSPKKGVIKKLAVKQGASLQADEVILEFEVEEEEAAA